MSALPSAIVFVNNDLVDSVREMLIKQLHIDQTFTGSQFDDIIANNPDYPQTVKQLRQRIMVIRSFEELENREIPDVVLFVKAGLASVEKNNFGPPGITLQVINLYWGALGKFGLPFD